MKIVCFDTATDALSCALRVDGELLEHHETAPRRHADRLLSVVDRLLAEAGVSGRELDAIGFGCGPGSFTGLRIAAATAQGLAFSLDLPVVPVSTLAVMAQGCFRERRARRVLAVLDARLGEVYAGAMQEDSGLMRSVRAERLCRPEELIEELGTEDGGWIGCGPGWLVCGDAMRDGLGARLERIEPERLPRACDLVALARARWEAGLAMSPERALPVYLRREVARRPEGRKR